MAVLTALSLAWAGLLGGGLAGTVAAQTGRSPSAPRALGAPKAYTPAPGSPERRAILAALRAKLYSLHQLEASFEVRHLKVQGGWAWVQAQPRSADGSQRFEDVHALLRKADSGWRVEDFPCTEEDNPECVGQPGFFRTLRARFPQLPPDILPAPGE